MRRLTIAREVQYLPIRLAQGTPQANKEIPDAALWKRGNPVADAYFLVWVAPHAKQTSIVSVGIGKPPEKGIYRIFLSMGSSHRSHQRPLGNGDRESLTRGVRAKWEVEEEEECRKRGDIKVVWRSISGAGTNTQMQGPGFFMQMGNWKNRSLSFRA